MKSEKNSINPKQSRAMATRQKIIEKGFEIIAKKGFHNTTVDEIAKEAGLSTGVCYRYFKNKKEILMAALEWAFSIVAQRTKTNEEVLKKLTSMEKIIDYSLDQFCILHEKYFKAHEEIESMRLIDEDVAKLYETVEKNAIENIIDKLPPNLKNITNIKERLYIASGIMENYCHMFVRNKETMLDMKITKKYTVDAVLKILEI